MKVRKLIDYLEQFDTEKEVFIFEMSDLYDTMLVAIEEDEKAVYINIKNLPRGSRKDIIQ